MKGVGFFEKEDKKSQEKIANAIVSSLLQHNLQMQKLFPKSKTD